MELSHKEIMDVIIQQELDHYRIYKSPTAPQHNKKFAFCALLALKKLKKEIKNKENAGNKNKGW